MLRLSRLTDYAVVALYELSCDDSAQLSAQALSKSTALSEPTVAKVLKLLARARIVRSQRGHQGGYSLARSPKAISLHDIITAIEGPVSLTACVEFGEGCDMQGECRIFGKWERVNHAVSQTLEEITLAELIEDFSPIPDFITRKAEIVPASLKTKKDIL